MGSLSQGAELRAFTLGVYSDHAECWECTWVPFGGRYALKFANRFCPQHGGLLP